MDLLKVGELARRTGLTVRTLHHYDEMGLLTPSRRSSTTSGPGYRLYGAEDVERLTRILLLKSLGLSLDEIRSLLDGEGISLERAIERRIESLRDEIGHRTRLLRRLEALAARTDSSIGAGEGAPTEDLLETLEMMTMYEKHFTEEQLETLERRGEALGEDRIRRVEEKEWPELITAVRAAMDRGADPASEEVQGLAARWQALVEEFTGGDPGIAESVRTVYREEPSARQKTGLDPEIMEYIGRAKAAGGEGDGG